MSKTGRGTFQMRRSRVTAKALKQLDDMHAAYDGRYSRAAIVADAVEYYAKHHKRRRKR